MCMPFSDLFDNAEMSGVEYQMPKSGRFKTIQYWKHLTQLIKQTVLHFLWGSSDYSRTGVFALKCYVSVVPAESLNCFLMSYSAYN